MLRAASVLSRTTGRNAALTSVRTIATGARGGSEIAVTIPDSSFETYLLENAPSTNVEIGKETMLDMYRQMIIVRRLEMAADALYKAKEIRGFCHLSIGQEAIACGMEKAILPVDSVLTSYRCHGFAYTRGDSVESIIAELVGKEKGTSHGLGGSMHLFGKNFFGGHGIVGAQVALGLGLGWAHHYSGDGGVNFNLYGDGAANQGQIFESYNMAKLWNLPVVFICENNRYGMGTAINRGSASLDFYKRGEFIPGIKINGMDSLAVYQGIKYAREWASSGKGPLVIEMATYRYSGHSMSDPGTTYRTREEVQYERAHHDCINGLKAKMVELGLGTEAEFKAVEKQCRSFVDEEVKKAVSGPWPKVDKETLYKYSYFNHVPPYGYRGRIPSENYYPAGTTKV